MDSQAVCQIAKELFPIPDSHHQNRELVEKIFLRQKVEYCLQKNSLSKISLQKSYLEHRDISPTRPGIECQTPLFDHYCKSSKNSERLLLDTLIAQFGISTSPFEALPDTATEPVGDLLTYITFINIAVHLKFIKQILMGIYIPVSHHPHFQILYFPYNRFRGVV